MSLAGDPPVHRCERPMVAKIHSGRRVWVCPPCANERTRERYASRKAAGLPPYQYSRPLDERRAVGRAKWKRLRDAAMAAYGGACACCGERELAFLSIDHVNNDGAKHRREIGRSMYQWLKMQNYPQDGRFQVLCYNCNLAKQFNGSCPHSTRGGGV